MIRRPPRSTQSRSSAASDVYKRQAWQALKPGGLFLNHGITAAAHDKGSYNPRDRYVFQKGAFIRKYVFPDGELIPVGDMDGMAERAGFEVRDVESLREHYALTLKHWVRRLEEHSEEALRQVDERTYRVWPVSYTHLRAHETRHDLVCRLLL